MKLVFKFESNLESNCKVHKRVFGTTSFLDLDLNVNPHYRFNIKTRPEIPIVYGVPLLCIMHPCIWSALRFSNQSTSLKSILGHVDAVLHEEECIMGTKTHVHGCPYSP